MVNIIVSIMVGVELYKIQFTVRLGPPNADTQTNSYGKKPPYLQRKKPIFGWTKNLQGRRER